MCPKSTFLRFTQYCGERGSVRPVYRPKGWKESARSLAKRRKKNNFLTAFLFLKIIKQLSKHLYDKIQRQRTFCKCLIISQEYGRWPQLEPSRPRSKDRRRTLSCLSLLLGSLLADNTPTAGCTHTAFK